MTRRFISITLCLCMILSIALPVGASVQSEYYTDVFTDDDYYSAVKYLYEHEIIRGTTDTTFSPNDAITRGQIVVAFWRMLNKPSPVGTVTQFSDIPSSSYFYDAVRWASSSGIGIVMGNGDGTYNPDGTITQQDMMVFLYRLAYYCEYSDNSTSAQNEYINILANSPLVNKNNFINYSRAAGGWGYDNEFIEDMNIVPTSNCTRGSMALYLHKFYMTFQKKYALSVTSTSLIYKGEYYGITCGLAMQNLFIHNDAVTSEMKYDITKTQFSNYMNSVFQDAKPLDMCYLFLASHGSASGLSLFTGSSDLLSPSYLRSQIDLYKGTFVVFVSGCNSGTYITNGTTNMELNGNNFEIEDNYFDADLFVNQLIYGDKTNSTQSTNLTNSARIKVLCSSRVDETSYLSQDYATNYWCLGCGYNYKQNQFVDLFADSNGDERVSLNELFLYSYYLINTSVPRQHAVCYPQNDNFIIFERDY